MRAGGDKRFTFDRQTYKPLLSALAAFNSASLSSICGTSNSFCSKSILCQSRLMLRLVQGKKKRLTLLLFLNREMSLCIERTEEVSSLAIEFKYPVMISAC